MDSHSPHESLVIIKAARGFSEKETEPIVDGVIEKNDGPDLLLQRFAKRRRQAAPGGPGHLVGTKGLVMTEFRSGDYVPPCVAACSVHLNIPRYVRAISERRFANALTIIEEKLPFSSVCGEICTHSCETACNANHLTGKGPIAIRAMKRFVAESSGDETHINPVENTTDERVAVVAAGPAGLTAAYYLKRVGHSVTVLESEPEPIDSARSALRLGSEVTVLYRRSREDMPASTDEVSDAEAEGAIFEYLAAPVRMEDCGDGIRVECVRTSMQSVQGDSRLFPIPVPGTEFTMEAAHVISAVGRVSAMPAEFDLACTSEGLIQVDKELPSTNRPGVFAGGDAVSDPASFIEAVEAGRQAAVSIDRYLDGQGGIRIRAAKEDDRVMQTELQGIPVGNRVSMPSLDMGDRRKDFAQEARGFTQEQALKEAGRRLRCDRPIQVDAHKCTGCMTCVMRCSLRFQMAFDPRASNIRVISYSDEKINEIFFQQTCDGCGTCARHCPHGALFRGKMAAEQMGL